MSKGALVSLIFKGTRRLYNWLNAQSTGGKSYLVLETYSVAKG